MAPMPGERRRRGRNARRHRPTAATGLHSAFCALHSGLWLLCFVDENRKRWSRASRTASGRIGIVRQRLRAASRGGSTSPWPYPQRPVPKSDQSRKPPRKLNLAWDLRHARRRGIPSLMEQQPWTV